MNKRTRSTKSKKWRQTCNSVEIAWTNEQKVAVTSYGRNKNHDDEIKNIAGRIPEATRSVTFTNKTVIEAAATRFCIKPLTHYLSMSALKIGDFKNLNKPLSPRDTKCKNSKLLKTFDNVKKSEIIQMVTKQSSWKSWRGNQLPLNNSWFYSEKDRESKRQIIILETKLNLFKKESSNLRIRKHL